MTAPADGRVLVVVELQGGNDGLSTLVPVDDARYHDVRPSLALSEAEVVSFADTLALNRRLAPLKDRGLAVLAGVGSPSPSLSHFDMMNRWWAGTPARTTRGQSGFLGRLAASLPAADEPSGFAISARPSPALRVRGGATVSVPTAEPLATAIRGSATAGASLHAALDGFARLAPPDDSLGQMSGESYAGLLQIDRILRRIPTVDQRFTAADPSVDEFARQLGFAAQLIAAEPGIRVIHLRMGHGDFDTHAAHRPRHDALMDVLGTGLALFVDALRSAGHADRVLVATTSEFGRRVAENQGGLDHGAGSCALLLGPVVAGLHGDPPSVSDVDPDGNLRASVGFDRYQATLATWLGVEPRDVLDGKPRALEGILTA